jgi:DNA polymerase/3'-5' exonuclease PolX
MSELNFNIISNFNKLIKQTEEECFQLKEDGNKKEATVCQFKIKNYQNGLAILKKFKEVITSPDDVAGIPGIGKGMMTRIDEILKTGTLAELKISSKESGSSKLVEINKLQEITGIGPKSAHKMYEQGITLQLLLNELAQISGKNDPRDLPVDEIMNKSLNLNLHIHELTHHQIIGLKYFNDINERIPREEITKLETKLIKLANKIDPKLIVTICGSYRRELDTSGDIDVLITHPDLENDEDIENTGQQYLIDLVDKLTHAKLLVDHLTTLGTTKYMGICRLTSKSKGRRIDIRFVARDDYAPALLYFTGSKNFNQKMRAEALKLGYTINEYGIYKLIKKDGIQTNKKGIKIITKTEEDIFKLVKMDYLEPKNRI